LFDFELIAAAMRPGAMASVLGWLANLFNEKPANLLLKRP
jgi:hypothetical protein